MVVAAEIIFVELSLRQVLPSVELQAGFLDPGTVLTPRLRRYKMGSASAPTHLPQPVLGASKQVG